VLPPEIAGLAATEVIAAAKSCVLVAARGQSPGEGEAVTPALAAKILQYNSSTERSWGSLARESRGGGRDRVLG